MLAACAEADCVVLVTDHTAFDYAAIAERSRLIVDTRNALGVAQLLERERLPGSFFAVTQIVAEDEDLARALALAGELGSQTASHIPLAGLTAQDQTLRLRRSWAHIEDWTGSGPLGLRPPEDAFDATTLRAWRQAGGMYLDRKSTRLNSSHMSESRMPSSA